MDDNEITREEEYTDKGECTAGLTDGGMHSEKENTEP